MLLAGSGSGDFMLASKKQQLLLTGTAASADGPAPETPLLAALFQSKSSDPDVLAFLSYVTKYMQLHNMALPINFPADHPVEEAGRYVLQCYSY